MYNYIQENLDYSFGKFYKNVILVGIGILEKRLYAFCDY